MVRKFSLLIVLVMLCSACTSKVEELTEEIVSDSISVRRAPISPNNMAYTSPSELFSYYQNDPTNVIHYNVARLLAETELIAGANFALSSVTDPYDGWYLTKYPKVVLNYDNTPKYYEFGYVCNGQIVATITTYAKKEIAGVIAYLFNDPLDYSCPNLDYYIGKYPNRYYGIGGTCYLKNCDEELDQELGEHGSTDEEELALILQQMTDEDRDGIQQDMEEQGESLNDDINEKDEYWQQIDDFVENNLQDLLNGEEIEGDDENLILQDFITESVENGTGLESDYVDQLAELLDYQVGFFHTGTLNEYSDPRLQVTHWSGFCGPAACAWVYRGKYDSYNGYYLPIYGDGHLYNSYFYDYCPNGNYAEYNYYNSQLSVGRNAALAEYNSISAVADNGLCACFYNETVPFLAGEWQFPLYHGGLNRGFNIATNGQYKVKLTCKPYDWITLNDQPIIIGIDCNHYIVAFGYGITKKKNGNVKDKYFLVTDNGATTGPKYHPYMRKKNFWNLHYGLLKLY